MALSLLTVMIRHRDGWDITMEKIGAQYGYGEKAMAGAMGLLQVARYVVKVRIMDAETRQWSTEVVVYDTPASGEEISALLDAIRAESDVRQAQVIEPTAKAQERAAKRRAELGAESIRPAQQVRIPRLRPDVDSGTTCGNEEKPQVTPDSAPGRDSREEGVFKKTVSKKTEEKTMGVGDGRRPSAGGKRAEGSGGSAAASKSGTIPTTRTNPGKPVEGEAEVFALLDALRISPTEAARIPTLRTAVRTLLRAGRTPENAAARVSAGWWRQEGPKRSAPEYRGCARCTARGCPASREECDRIVRPVGYLADLLSRQECERPDCERGVIMSTGEECRACGLRAEERSIERAAARFATSLGSTIPGQRPDLAMTGEYA